MKQDILLTADTVVIKKTHETDFVLLIQRKNEPFKGQWALPGGFAEVEEKLEETAARELEEETGLAISPQQLDQIGAFGDPGRDPRGRVVTVAFYVEVQEDVGEVQAADDAAAVKWWSINNLPALAFDHERIITGVIGRG